jgi:hypothetical protein
MPSLNLLLSPTTSCSSLINLIARSRFNNPMSIIIYIIIYIISKLFMIYRGELILIYINARKVLRYII